MIGRGHMSSVTNRLLPLAAARRQLLFGLWGGRKLENIRRGWKAFTACLRDFRDPVEKS